jgi:hypothetical protein
VDYMLQVTKVFDFDTFFYFVLSLYFQIKIVTNHMLPLFSESRALN